MDERRIPSPDEITDALRKLRESPDFRATQRQYQFLNHIVSETLAGRADQIKGYTIGVDVFGKGADFDPQSDPVVRLEASRLRRNLEHYYLTDGSQDAVRISLPKGSYVPAFDFASGHQPDQPRAEIPVTAQSITRENNADGLPAAVSAAGNRSRALAAAGIAAVACLGVLAWLVLRPLADAPPRNVRGLTVYVQPFEAAAPSASQLSHGITTELVSVLSNFAELRVYPVSPAFVRPEAEPTDPSSYGFRLSGTVQVVGKDLRVTARLQDAGDGLQVWTERYDANYLPQEVFAIQDQIAVQVARTLAEPFGLLRQLSRENLADRRDPGLAAYKCVLLGYEYRQHFTEDLHGAARSCLETAVDADPDYARAWALLAHIYADEYRAFFNVMPNARARSLDAARKAMEIDPDDVLSHQAMSLAHFVNGDIEAALKAAKVAVEKNPHNTEALLQLGMRTAFSGQWDRGHDIVQQAIRESASAPSWYHFFAALYHYQKREYQAARTAIEKVRAIRLTLVELGRAMIYGQAGVDEAASRALDNARRLDDQLDERARKWLAVHNIDDAVLDHMMEGLFKAGLRRPRP